MEKYLLDFPNSYSQLIIQHSQFLRVLVGPSEVGEALEGAVGAVACAVGVGVFDEGALYGWHDDLANGVVNYSIAVGCSGDEARFGFVDLKVTVGTGLIGLGFEFVLEFEEFRFQIVMKF
jgi:hypothetical protein